MNIEQFKTYADSYGSDISKWPKELQGEAGIALSEHKEAREHIKQTAKLDALLDMAKPSAEPLQRLEQRIAEQTSAAPTTRNQWVLFRYAGAAVMTLMVLGIIIGVQMDDGKQPQNMANAPKTSDEIQLTEEEIEYLFAEDIFQEICDDFERC